MVHHSKKMEELQVSSRTFVDWSSFCREVCMHYLTRRSVLLGGEGVTVEIDEAKIGKRKYNRGRRIEDQWIFGGYERARATFSSFQFRIEPRIPCLSSYESTYDLAPQSFPIVGALTSV
ncbi:uncharacterized protein LOC116167416 [Photinus pyralis]|uniref:uncharacterized protein LOC116167416 n=1 Tax=Photinus pyralis TaxID=7054 RepID=UPI0012672E4D|nr:uncharacterized protein LOC116167416 [Photinus pyralis]